MLYQKYLDTREEFQALIDKQIKRLKTIEDEKRLHNKKTIKLAKLDGTEPQLLKIYPISKARLFSAAIYAATTVDIEVFAKYYLLDRKKHSDLPSISQERKLNKEVKHKFVFLRIEHLDYIQYRSGQMGMVYQRRFENDRDFVHMALRYFSTLNNANAARYVALSTKIHPTSTRHEKPNGSKKK